MVSGPSSATHLCTYLAFTRWKKKTNPRYSMYRACCSPVRRLCGYVSPFPRYFYTPSGLSWRRSVFVALCPRCFRFVRPCCMLFVLKAFAFGGVYGVGCCCGVGPRTSPNGVWGAEGGGSVKLPFLPSPGPRARWVSGAAGAELETVLSLVRAAIRRPEVSQRGATSSPEGSRGKSRGRGGVAVGCKREGETRRALRDVASRTVTKRARVVLMLLTPPQLCTLEAVFLVPFQFPCFSACSRGGR